MEAVKMTAQVSGKANKAASRTAASDSTVQKDTFLKLLQEKKNLTEPGKAEAESGEEGKEVQKAKVQDGSRDKEKQPEQSEKETADVTPQEVLLLAGIDQAAVQIQMTESLTEVTEALAVETTPEIVAQAAGIDAIVSSEEEPKEVPIAAQEAGNEEKGADMRIFRTQEKEAEPVVSREEKPDGDSSVPLGEEKHSDVPRDTRVENSVKEPAEETAKTVARPQTGVSPTAWEERKTQPEQNTGQGVYHTEGPGDRIQQPFIKQGTETIPMKTGYSDLPQDLGKTLASRLPGNGRELVIELEPASLGKLTIKMVYEGSRAAVSILATNPRTLELLSQKASEIASILEEKTGQETVIYTQAPEKENQDSQENPNGGQSGRQPDRERRSRENDRHETESFAQQLRLGLV